MDNFDLKKYLAEGKLQNEQSDFEIGHSDRMKELISKLDLLVYDEYHADVYMNDNIKLAFDALVDAIKDEGESLPTMESVKASSAAKKEEIIKVLKEEKSDLSNILFDISTLLDSLDNEQLQNTAKLSDADSKLLRKSVDNMLKSLSPVKYLIDTTQLSNE